MGFRPLVQSTHDDDDVHSFQWDPMRQGGCLSDTGNGIYQRVTTGGWNHCL